MESSKHVAIRKHLKGGQSITGLEAWRLFGVYRLAVVIHRLRHIEGLSIRTDLVEIGSGKNKVNFARYRYNDDTRAVERK